MSEYPTALLDKVEALQNELIARATGNAFDDDLYRRLRSELLTVPAIATRLPRYVKTSRDLDQFWQFIKYEFDNYRDRRQYIWAAFQPILQQLEGLDVVPSDALVSEALVQFDPEHVHEVWNKALERRSTDPEGAITAGRTLLESVCKHILEAAAVEYPDNADLPKLYRLTAEQLQLAPSQHSEAVFKQILGGCQAVVEGLGAARNRLSDSHGQGRRSAKPAPRHAELAVNLAGSMALFLVATFQARATSAPQST